MCTFFVWGDRSKREGHVWGETRNERCSNFTKQRRGDGLSSSVLVFAITDFVAFAFVGVPLRARETRVKRLHFWRVLSLSLSLSETRT